MKRVVIVSYHFPPYGGKAVQRASKLAKYLPEFGWKPLVLTMPLGEAGVPMDPTLLDELPESVEIHRPEYRNWWKLVPHDIRKFIHHPLPDKYRVWTDAVEDRLVELIEGSGADALLSTSPSHSVQLLGLAAKRRTGVPWAADFRDQWTGHPDFGARRDAGRLRDMETEVITAADAVVGVVPRILRDFEGRVPPEKMHLIENGYDEDDFRLVDWDYVRDGDVLWMGYNGTVSDYHDPGPLLAPLESAVGNGALDPRSLRVVFTTGPGGRKRFEPYRRLRESGVLLVRDYLPHARSLAELSGMDVSLLLATKGRDLYSGKIFEYFYLGNPILSLSTPGDDLDRLIKETSTGTVVDYRDPEAVVSAVLELASKKKRGELDRSNRPRKDLDRFSRRSLAGRYAEILENMGSP